MGSQGDRQESGIQGAVEGNWVVFDWSVLGLSLEHRDSGRLNYNGKVVLVWIEGKCIECACNPSTHRFWLPNLRMYCPRCPGMQLRGIDPDDASNQVTELKLPAFFYDCTPGTQRWSSTDWQFELTANTENSQQTFFREMTWWSSEWERKFKNSPFIAPRQHNQVKPILAADQSGECAGCGRKFPLEDLTVDHTRPVSKGGKRTFNNMTAMCEPCNQDKADKS